MIRANSVLVDTGPLVAILSPDDSSHQLCSEQLKSLPAPLLDEFRFAGIFRN